MIREKRNAAEIAEVTKKMEEEKAALKKAAEEEKKELEAIKLAGPQPSMETAAGPLEYIESLVNKSDDKKVLLNRFHFSKSTFRGDK